MMADKEMFSYWVTQPELLEKSDIARLERITEEYPYFQLAHMLLAKAVSVGQPESLTRYLPKAAIYALNRKALQALVENEMEWSVELLDRLTRTRPGTADAADEKAVSPAPPEDQPEAGRQNDRQLSYDPTALAEFALSYQLSEQLKDGQGKNAGAPSRTPIQELIDKFIKTEPVMGALTPESGQNDQVEDLSSRNQMALEDFATESFAEILVRQGKTERAIGIYEKLILKIPEKKDYFAEKINRLK
ncbi:MAG: hypothetical protein ABS46_11170 [Cytophagaceae bacterium SCN 52-12]|nr:MAG: hypothetical protein ABS46_11170 [Cytophagaceae bacterium SCN 52-12]